MMNGPSIQIPLTVRLSEIWRRMRGRTPDATYFDRDGMFLGSAREPFNTAKTSPSRRAFMALGMAAAASSLPSQTIQNNDSALGARHDELTDAIHAIRPLVLQAIGTHAQGGNASAVLINIDKGLLALSAHQAPVGSVIVLGPHAGHAVPELVFEARVLNATNTPEANGQDAALAQILPESRRAYERYVNSIDGLQSPTLAPIAPDRLRDDSTYFIAGYAGGTSKLVVSRATPDFTDAPNAHLPGGLINECAYQMRVEDLRVSQGGVSGGGMFEVKADGEVIYHGIITALQANDPSRPLFFTPISVLNTALAQHGLQPMPRGAFGSCEPKPVESLINHRVQNRRGLIAR